MGGRAAIYARFSSHNQRGESIEIQVEKSRAYCAENDLRVVATYCDFAQTDTNTDRAEFQRMMADAKRGLFDFVVIYKVTRIMRNRDEMAMARIMLRRCRVEILYAGEDISDGSAGVLQLGMLEVLAEYESALDGERIRDGIQKNAERCMANGCVRYGWDIVDGRYVVNEEEAAAIRLGVRMVLSGKSVADVVRAWEPYRTKRGGKWRFQTVRRILMRRENGGEYRYAGVVVPGGMPAIVPMDDEERVIRMLEDSHRPRAKTEAWDFPLTGKLYDGRDGGLMTGTSGTGKSGRPYHYYRCRSCGRTVRRDGMEKRVADAVRAAGIPCFGPGAEGAQMEGSKLFSKQLMERAGIPTAAYGSFTDEASALAYVREQGAPLVVKADGLAAGKGVIVATELEQAEEAVRECFGGTFGDAGNTVVIEEMLVGPECSLLAFTDGKTVRPMATSQDHKRALEGDKGPNTGGMGVYSPVPIVTDEEHATMVKVMEQTVAELAAEGIDYRGCLYGGFMLTPAGPKVLEFNARFGDPETQVVLPRLKNDLVEVMLACANCELDQIELDWRDEWAVAVVLTSAGYPGSYEKGKVITGIADAEAMENVTVYHAGTAVVDGQLVTNGGRVLAVTALGDTFENARNLAYEACEKIDFEGKTLRHDIGLRALRGRDAWDA